MFKSLNSLEKTMRKVLLLTIKDNNISNLDLFDNNISYALHECIKNDYITGIQEHKNANGKYKFNPMPHIMVTQNGLAFIKATSKVNIILSNIFSILRGVCGFLIGIIGTLIVTYISWYNGWI